MQTSLDSEERGVSSSFIESMVKKHINIFLASRPHWEQLYGTTVRTICIRVLIVANKKNYD